MGLREFFKSHKNMKGKTGRTQESSSNTTLTVNSSYANRDSWDEAYDALRTENEDLIRKVLLSRHRNRSSRREEQLRQVVTTVVDEVDLAKWQTKAGSHSFILRGQFDQAVKIVIASKDFISSAVSSDPHAALA
ncbi:hypothetical protein TSTA_067860 [Talaromyces stipitatus ATCC 10500]|uniref:NWD NACHT-NTPase N-terminal domain-containing protein n=1 Tax=Talaromyces stipitatus (strain ATCC 10500 / CBS 375.48 / QM 6759 / NRRL 1006) TaxID=441959 RepID=B8LYJ9_TALSN|nr:uncharacterized protein TSTA_067860 [Talaromyces stipitatus ATCC 10500]EED23357.1 hypothetical protein TSTA_067860 [Talaromyces stipitatus ATCC 10500]